MISKIIEFFSTEKIKTKIQTNKLTEGQLFLYFYAILVYDAIGFTQGWLSIAGKPVTYSTVAIIWGNLLITVVGLIVLFISNGGYRGKQFLTKYFSFSFTVGIKYAVIFLILGLLPIDSQLYNLSVFFVLNIMMIANIAYRIYQCSDKVM